MYVQYIDITMDENEEMAEETNYTQQLIDNGSPSSATIKTQRHNE